MGGGGGMPGKSDRSVMGSCADYDRHESAHEHDGRRQMSVDQEEYPILTLHPYPGSDAHRIHTVQQ
jgi:hypothetical protein